MANPSFFSVCIYSRPSALPLFKLLFSNACLTGSEVDSDCRIRSSLHYTGSSSTAGDVYRIDLHNATGEICAEGINTDNMCNIAYSR